MNLIRVATVCVCYVFLCILLPLDVHAAGIYPSSNLGYDLSYNTRVYPQTGFNFAIVGVNAGKAFTYNSRLVSEYNWAKFGSATAPTLYMNLNAPYGSTVAGHISRPKTCPVRVATSSLSAGSAQAGPTECEGYNYGYNAAEDAYAYTQTKGTMSEFWWLDIEEANSWSATTTVNAATIQGAIDYLNTRSVRVGIYSMPRMWREIAGKGFTPTQTIGGKAVVIPTWLPVGVMSQVSATNACVTKKSFIPGSPIWLIQYEASSSAIDQNLSC